MFKNFQLLTLYLCNGTLPKTSPFAEVEMWM